MIVIIAFGTALGIIIVVIWGSSYFNRNVK